MARLFRRRGLAPSEGVEAVTEEPPLLLELGAASAAGTVVQGPRAGARIPPVDPFGSLAFVPGSDRIAGEAGGFNLHARVAVKAHDRAGLERLCRYLARPPIATDRLELRPDGRVRYWFERAWRNGTTFVDYEPSEGPIGSGMPG